MQTLQPLQYLRPVSRPKALPAFLAFVALIWFGTAGLAQTISVDYFVGSGSDQLGAAEVAGYVPAANWNSYAVVLQRRGQALKDSAGAATGATATWSSESAYTVPFRTGPGNLKMMKAYLDTSDTSINTVTVATLPASLASGGYSVIVYYDGDNGDKDRVGKYSITGAGTGNATYWGRDAAGSTFAGTFTRAQTATDPLAGGGPMDNNLPDALSVPAGNMMIFRGLTGSGFTLRAQGSVSADVYNRGPLQAFQIVPDALVPEPASLSLLAVGAAGLLLRRRRRA